jgi:2-dehydro-3-deoxyphosphooctonate aldolase (KDO 8-P synthase)
MSPPEVELATGIRTGPGALPIVAGPCVIESAEQTLAAGRAVAAIGRALGAPIIFKASYDKANRSALGSFRGPGLEAGLEVLAAVAAETGMPLLTDVHAPEQCEAAAEVCAVLQIPAFLCRQTDLILAAAATGRAVNIKKGQFMAPGDMRRAVEKARSTGNDRITVTERGVTFGYRNLVVDMRSFNLMHDDGIAVIYDVTHSLQLPGAAGEETGGDRRFAEPLARAAVAAGADGVYLEVHPDPERALSDRATQLDPGRAEALLGDLLELRRLVSPPVAVAP